MKKQFLLSILVGGDLLSGCGKKEIENGMFNCHTNNTTSQQQEQKLSNVNQYSNKETSSNSKGIRAVSPTKLVFTTDKKWCTINEKKEFFKQLGLTYTDELLFDKECEFLKNIKFNQLKIYNYYTKTLIRLCTESYGNLISVNKEAPGYIMWVSDEIGYGFFANQNIVKGTLIVATTGKIVKRSSRIKNTWAWQYPFTGYFIGYGQDFVLDATKYGNEARFINHSDKNNIDMRFVFCEKNKSWYIVYIANKNIAKDVEYLTNYGSGYWENKIKIEL